MIVPVGLTPPVSEAVSWIALPTTTDSLAVVAMAGLALMTVSFSPASPQAPAIGALLPSPLYEAIQWYVPTASGVKVTGPYEPLPLTVRVSVKRAGPLQSAVAYRLKVIVPVAPTAPLRTAVSWIALPMTTDSAALVAMPGVAGLTTTDSFASLHAPETALLFASPP